MNNSAWVSLILVLILGYFVLYFSGRKYLEHFAETEGYSAGHGDNQRNNPNTMHNTMHNSLNKIPNKTPETPYLTNSINEIDDYEVSSVFHNEGSKAASKKDISDAMSMYPLDWAVQGQNSQYFQENQEEYKKNMKTMQPVQPFDGNSAAPLTDTISQDEEEKKILQTYVPESSKGLLEYSIDDVKQLLKKIYSRKGLIPVIKKSKQGENIWEVVEVKEKHPKIVWEDETEAPRQMKRERGEDVIRVPYTVSDAAAGMDPFFQSNPSSRMGKHDYTQFTPGLERMFAPTFPVKSWF